VHAAGRTAGPASTLRFWVCAVVIFSNYQRNLLSMAVYSVQVWEAVTIDPRKKTSTSRCASAVMWWGWG